MYGNMSKIIEYINNHQDKYNNTNIYISHECEDKETSPAGRLAAKITF